MDKNYYNQCFWDATGELNCKRVALEYDENLYKKYVQYSSFGKPNNNYKPNHYRKNTNFYNLPYEYNSGVDRNIKKFKPEPEWLSPPITKDKLEYYN